MPFFNENKKIEIILFQDAFEICNPIGSSKGKHKLIAIYMMVGNLHKMYRNQIKNIQLVLLSKEAHIKNFGFTEVLKPLIRELKILETKGLTVKDVFNDHSRNFQGTLFAMTGDNLGSHQIGGFYENFSRTKNFCRYCLYSREQLDSFSMNSCELRTPLNYKLSLVKQNENDIKCDSVLNQLSFYHVCNPGLPPCLSHDLFEGIIPFDLMQILKYYQKKNLKLFDYVNNYLYSLRKIFKLALSFPKIDIKMNKIPGKAFEVWQTINLMPIILLNIETDFENPAWKFFSAMVEICRIICSKEFSDDHLNILSHYINQYFECRKLVFPGLKLRPKHHYICHYPELLKQFGPLINLWTMPFEQKHQYFKEIARKVKNFKNITFTLANKHQEYQAAISENRFELQIISHSAKIFSRNTVNKDVPSKYIYNTQKIRYLGTSYKCNDFVLIDCNEQAEIEVLKIETIFINEFYDSALLYGSCLKFWYNQYSLLYESFDMENDHVQVYVELQKLIEKKPINILKHGKGYLFSPLTYFFK